MLSIHHGGLRVPARRSRLRQYALALAVVVATTLVRLAIDPLVLNQAVYVGYVACGVIVAWICGAEAGLFSVIVSAIVANYLFVPPRFEVIPHGDDIAAMAVFGLVSSSLVLLVGRWIETREALRQRAEELGTLLDTVPAAVFVTRHPSAGQVEGNRYAAEYTRRPLAADARLEPPADRPGGVRVVKDGHELTANTLPVQAAMASGGELRDYEFDLRYEDGSLRTLFGNAAPLRDENGRVRGAIGAFVDVTELKRMEGRLQEQARELERANRVKDDFLATLGHELRTPLNAIVGWASMLTRGGLGGEATRRAHEAIARNADAQRRLIEDMLDVSRIVSGKLRLEAERLDIVAPLRAAVESVRPHADEKGITIAAEFPESPATVLGDAGRLQQVFLNLLSNAVKFSDPGGVVGVSAARVDGEVHVRVQDAGIGITRELLPHVFERFWQADSSPTRKHTGLGLGLAIVRHLVELHGGSVAAESAGPGQGSAFVVKLPFRALEDRRWPRPAYRLAASPSPATATPSLGGVRVLVVDDEADGRELAASALAQAGAQVHLAASASEALAEVGPANPDVLLIDISMPEVDGYSLLRELRRRPGRAAQAPAIAFTAYARPEDRVRALASGFKLHLAKPVAADALVGAVASLAPGMKPSRRPA